MPWSKKQVRAFRAIANGAEMDDPSLRKISRKDAARMAAEGVKAGHTAKALARRTKRGKDE